MNVYVGSATDRDQHTGTQKRERPLAQPGGGDLRQVHKETLHKELRSKQGEKLDSKEHPGGGNICIQR